MEFPRVNRPVLDRNSFQMPGDATPSTASPVDLLPVSGRQGFFHSETQGVPHDPVYLPVEQITALISAFWRKAKLLPQPFVVGINNPLLVRAAEDRYYFFLINYDPLNTLTVNFGKAPAGVNDGIKLQPNGFYEPLAIPQQDIWLLGGAAGVVGELVVAAIQ